MTTNNPEVSSAGADAFQFDVIVSMPMNIEKSILRQKAVAGLGTTPENVDALLDSLAKHRVVKVKASILRDEADAVAEKFSAVGFRVELKHSLSIKKTVDVPQDKKIECPACDEFMLPTEDRQCPLCGVFIDKLTAEFLTRKRLMKQERLRLSAILEGQQRDNERTAQAELEKRIRDEIRAEIEKELGLDQQQKKSTVVTKYGVPALGVLAVVGAFLGGRVSGESTQKSAAAELAQVEADSPPPAVKLVENFLKGSAKMGAAMQKNGGGRSLSEIMAEAQAEGGGGGGGATLAGLDQNDFLPPAAGGGDTSAGEGGGGDASPKPARIQDAQARRMVSIELAQALAEMGQVERAREVVAKLYGDEKNTTDLGAAMAQRVLHLKVEAWDLAVDGGGSFAAQLDALAKEAGDIPDVAERAAAYATIGAILSRRPDSGAQAAEAFFQLAQQAYAAFVPVAKSKADKARRMLVEQELLTSRAEAIFNQARHAVAKGMQKKAQTLSLELEKLGKAAPGVVAAASYSLNSQLQRLMGDADAAKKNIDLALSEARKSPSLVDEARALRKVAIFSGAYGEQSLTNALVGLKALGVKNGGTDYAEVLLNVSLVHARFGNTEATQNFVELLGTLSKSGAQFAAYVERQKGLLAIESAWKAKKDENFPAMDAQLRLAASLV